jgi:hypothetical protein
MPKNRMRRLVRRRAYLSRQENDMSPKWGPLSRSPAIITHTFPFFGIVLCQRRTRARPVMNIYCVQLITAATREATLKRRNSVCAATAGVRQSFQPPLYCSVLCQLLLNSLWRRVIKMSNTTEDWHAHSQPTH